MRLTVAIREYRPDDCKETADLFFNTVHTVNASDYTREQLNVWATGQTDLAEWNKSLEKHRSFVAVYENKIVGFGDVDESGYLDRLFVHKDFQRRGVATAVCDRLERCIQGKITVHSSVTAKAFFEKRGYTVTERRREVRQNIELPYFVMTKQLK